MKTVKDYLNEIDANRLVSTFLYNYPSDEVDLLQYKKMTIEDYRNNVEKALYAFIDRLKNMEPVKPEDDDMHIFFAYRSEGDGDDGIGFGMVTGKELIEKGADANTYSCMFTKQEEIVGYYVAENDLTQHNIYDLLAFIMRESSSFGFKQERLEKTIQELEDAIDERKNHPESGRNAREVFKELREKLGEEYYEDEEGDDLKELRYKIVEAQINYRKYSIKEELGILIGKLAEN